MPAQAKCFMSRLRRSLLFFFSSRRPHTRSLRDWSSDVCSSDLDREGLWSGAHKPSRSPSSRQTSCGSEIGRASCRERVLSWAHDGLQLKMDYDAKAEELAKREVKRVRQTLYWLYDSCCHLCRVR